MYGIFILLAICVGAAVFSRFARRADAPRALPLALVAALGGLAGAKLFSIAERGGVVWWDPAWELGNGYRYPGGLTVALAVLLALRARCWPGISVGVAGDALAPAIAAAMAVVRVGCFLCGCCHGLPTSLPWALRAAPYTPAWRAHLERGWIAADSAASLPVHPLQLYFALVSLLTLAALLWLRRGAAPGLLLPLYLALDGAAKLALEGLRLDYRAALQAAAAAQAVAGVALLLSVRRRSRHSSSRRAS